MIERLDGIYPPRGKYSPIVVHNGIVYVSGQVSTNPETKQVPPTRREETLMALKKAEQLLEKAGSSRRHVLMCRIYVDDMAFWDEVNAGFAEFFPDDALPARIVLPVGNLGNGVHVEVDITAAVK